MPARTLNDFFVGFFLAGIEADEEMDVAMT